MNKEKQPVEDIKKMGQELLDPEKQAEVLRQLRQNSGEGESIPKLPFVPIIEVDNHKETETIKGRKVEVVCEPNYTITARKEKEGEEKAEYTSGIFGKELAGSILIVKYTVEKKYQPDDKSRYFRSFEFDEEAFKNSKINITVTSGGEKIFVGSYKDFKVQFEGRYVLNVVLYVKTLGEEGKLYRVRCKGINRTLFWDYRNIFGPQDSLAAHVTKFTLDTVAEGGKNYNHIVFTDEGYGNLEQIVKDQSELKAYLTALSNRDTAENTEEAKVEGTNDDLSSVKELSVDEIFADIVEEPEV